MKCKNDDNKILAKGLCRSCYDATPERKAKRNIYTKYLKSVGGKATRKRIVIGTSRKNNTEYMRAWRAKNPEKVKEANSKYNEENRDKVNAWSKAYYHNNKDARKAASSKWRKENYERYISRRRELALLKKGGVINDSKTKTRGNTTSNDKQISQVHTGYS